MLTPDESQQLFASLRQAVGRGALERALIAGSTVAELLDALSAEHPGLPDASSAVYAAVNRAYVDKERVLNDGDEVALFPPVSGGAAQRPLFEITEAPLSLDDVAARVAGPSRGAITVFAGMVRGETALDQETLYTKHLEYEAYAEMAEPLLAAIAEEVQERWPQIEAVSILHRIGRLEVGEPSVVIAVAAGHRGGVFEACSYAIERLKAVVPIWKKEVGSDGQWWVEGPRGANTPPPVA